MISFLKKLFGKGEETHPAPEEHIIEVSLDSFTKAELKDIAASRGIKVDMRKRKADIIATIESA